MEKIMRIFINDYGDLCLAFRHHHWEGDTIIVIPDDKATRRRINRVFRAVTPEKTLKKALRALSADEKAGLIVNDGYEYAIVLKDYISKVENSRF